jgi:hypothetical protein
VVVVRAERHHDPARDVVREEVLQLAQVRGLGSAEAPGVAPPYLVQEDRHVLAQVDLRAVDVQARAAARETAVGGPVLVAGEVVVDGVILRRHRGGLLQDHTPARRHDEEYLLAIVRPDPLVGAGPNHDVRDPERARQELDVREDIPLPQGQDPGRRVEIGRRLGQRDDLIAGVGVGRGGYP